MNLIDINEALEKKYGINEATLTDSPMPENGNFIKLNELEGCGGCRDSIIVDLDTAKIYENGFEKTLPLTYKDPLNDNKTKTLRQPGLIKLIRGYLNSVLKDIDIKERFKVNSLPQYGVYNFPDVKDKYDVIIDTNNKIYIYDNKSNDFKPKLKIIGTVNGEGYELSYNNGKFMKIQVPTFNSIVTKEKINPNAKIITFNRTIKNPLTDYKDATEDYLRAKEAESKALKEHIDGTPKFVDYNGDILDILNQDKDPSEIAYSSWGTRGNEDGVSKYTYTYYNWMCKEGHIWTTTAKGRTTGLGCPICKGNLGTSIPEKTIFTYIKEQYPNAVSGSYDYIKNPNTGRQMQLDIYIPELNIAIEYDSDFHLEDRDLLKNQACYEHNPPITLYRIREDSKFKEDIIKRDIFGGDYPTKRWTFKKVNFTQLIQCLNECFKEAFKDKTFDFSDFKQRREEVKQKFSDKENNIEQLANIGNPEDNWVYQNYILNWSDDNILKPKNCHLYSNEEIKFECHICHKKFTKTLNYLPGKFNGDLCPNRKSEEHIKWHQEHPNVIQLLGKEQKPYIDKLIKINQEQLNKK